MNIKNLLKGDNNILAKGLASTVIKLLGALFSYLLSYLIAKKFGAEGNGLFALFMSYIIVLSTFFYFGLDFFLVRQVSILIQNNRFQEVKELYFKILTKYIIPVAIISIFFGIIFGAYFNKTMVFTITIAVIINVFTDINSAVLRGMKKAEWYSFFMQFSKYFVVVILFFVPVLSNESESIIYLYILSLLINGTLSFSILNKYLITTSSGDLLKENNNQDSIFSILNSSKEFFFSSIIIISLVWIDFIIADVFLDEKSVGIYSVSLKLATLISFGFTAFNAFLAPRISEVYAVHNTEKLERLITQNFVLILPTILIPFIGIIFFNEDLLKFFGDEFKSGWIVLLLLAFGQFINSAFGPVSLLLQMTGNQKIFQNILVFALGFKLISSFFFVKSYRIEGLAIANSLTMCLWTLIGSYYVYKKIGVFSWFSVSELKKIIKV